jgi:hypothetical protein
LGNLTELNALFDSMAYSCERIASKKRRIQQQNLEKPIVKYTASILFLFALAVPSVYAQDPPPAEPAAAPAAPAEAAPAAPAQEAAAQPAPTGPLMHVVLEGLDNPSGIAIQPETGIVFISDSGAGRVVKVVNGVAEPVITDYKTDIYGKGPQYNIGPLGLAFLDKNTLVVGGGDLPDGEEALRVYDLTDMKEPLKVDAAKASFTLAANGDIKGEGNFYALAVNDKGVYVTCNGDDTKGWVSKATREGNALTGYERYLATKEATQVDAPVAITVTPNGHLLVGQMGEINVPNDSLITFYDPDSKAMLLNIETKLHDITSLAYSPREKMYALDFAWMDTTQGGLFQLVKDEATGVRTHKIVALDKPTAMAFGPDGTLYITVIGPEAKKGQLLKIDPGL